MVINFLLIGNEIERRRISFQSILYIRTDDYLSTFYFANSQKFCCSKPLCVIAECLPDYFIQINKGCIINLNEVSSVKRSENLIILSNGINLKVSIRRMKIFNAAFASQNVVILR